MAVANSNMISVLVDRRIRDYLSDPTLRIIVAAEPVIAAVNVGRDADMVAWSGVSANGSGAGEHSDNGRTARGERPFKVAVGCPCLAHNGNEDEDESGEDKAHAEFPPFS